MYGPLRNFITWHQHINLALLRWVQKVFALQGYTDETMRGVHLSSRVPNGSASSEEQPEGPATAQPEVHASQQQPSTIPIINDSEIVEQSCSQGETALSQIGADEEEDEDVENDDEFTRITEGVEAFVIGVND